MRKFVTIAAALGFLGATSLTPVFAASTDISSQATDAAKTDAAKPAKKMTKKHKAKAKKAHKMKKAKKSAHKKAAPKAKTSAIVYRIAA